MCIKRDVHHEMPCVQWTDIFHTFAFSDINNNNKKKSIQLIYLQPNKANYSQELRTTVQDTK
jgi:hypothetical protein